MLPVERHRFITEVLSQRGRVMVQEVAQLCHISIETARRDLALLERRGLLLRSHGGAVFVEPPAVEKTYVPAEISRRGIACCWTAAPPAGFWRANCRISRWWC